MLNFVGIPQGQGLTQLNLIFLSPFRLEHFTSTVFNILGIFNFWPQFIFLLSIESHLEAVKAQETWHVYEFVSDFVNIL